MLQNLQSKIIEWGRVHSSAPAKWIALEIFLILHQLKVSANGEVERKVSGQVESGGGQLNVMVPAGPNHRRKRYSDLKSVYEKREEMRANEPMLRTWDTNKKAEKFEF